MIQRDHVARMLPSGLRKTLYDQYRTYRLLRSRLSMRDGIVAHNGVRLRADGRLGEEVVQQIMNGDYEAREARMVRMFLETGDVVLELGAGIGFIGLLCAKTVGPENVHSFEANPLMESVIRRTTRSMNARRTSRWRCSLIGAAKSACTSPSSSGRRRLLPCSGAHEVTIPCLPFNETVRQLRPTFLIMDIEGGEVEIVKLLEPGSIRKVAMERHPEVTGERAIVEMERRLSELGFTCRWVSSNGTHAYFEVGAAR